MSRILSARASVSSLRNSRPASQSEGLGESGEGGEQDPLLEADGAEGVDLIKVVENQPTYPLIHVIRKEIKRTIDTHLTWEELTAVDLNYTLVRPLAVKYSQYKSIAILFCMLFNRVQFLRDSERDLAFQNVNLTRAALCELLAIKLLRTFSNDGLELVTALTASFSPFSGADDGALTDLAMSGKIHALSQTNSALELAVVSSAKKFIKSPLCQRCIDGIWTGRVVLSSHASHALVNDSYKKRPLQIYDPSKAPLLDHYRLRVPLVRSRLEFLNFILLLVFYISALQQKDSPTWTAWETVFTIWLCGFALDEFASLQEHGVKIYLGSLYNNLDVVFCIIGFSWLGLRISGLVHHNQVRSDLSFDCLALGSVLLLPRCASALVQDNVVLLALRAMLGQFAFFMIIAAICFSGFLYAFYSLSDHTEWTFARIGWTLLKVWFGNNYVGFDTAQSFSPIFGPFLMVLFAVLSNTLLLTVLISLLSNTFMNVSQNAGEEAMYQHACQTLGGITTDAVFSYQPPLNLIALVVMLPASHILSPRWLHKLNVFLIRLTSFPILLVIRLCERHSFRAGLELTAERAGKAFSWVPLPRALEGWRGKGEVDIVEAVFCRENIALEAESWDDWNEPKDTQAPEGTDAASVKEHSDDEHEHELESHSTPHEPEAVRTSRTAGPSRGRQNRFSGAPLQMHKARGSFEQARIEGEPATVPRERSSGQLPRSRTMQDVASRVPTAGPSPLARIFSGAARGISPSVHWKPPSAPSSPGYDPSNWIGRGTFSGALDRCVEERENAELPHAVIDRLNSMEQRQQRIESLLMKLTADLRPVPEDA